MSDAKSETDGVHSKDISERLLDQRLRNRYMEELLALSRGEEYLREQGAIEYFNCFFFWEGFDDQFPPNSAMTALEHQAFSDVEKLMREASDATPKMVTDKQLMHSGWPQRIAPVAKVALSVFMQRGRFSEEHEEDD